MEKVKWYGGSFLAAVLATLALFALGIKLFPVPMLVWLVAVIGKLIWDIKLAGKIFKGGRKRAQEIHAQTEQELAAAAVQQIEAGYEDEVAGLQLLLRSSSGGRAVDLLASSQDAVRTERARHYRDMLITLDEAGADPDQMLQALDMATRQPEIPRRQEQPKPRRKRKLPSWMTDDYEALD